MKSIGKKVKATGRFLYSTLNCALPVMNGEVLTLMGLFIGDLHRQIEQPHPQQYGDVSVAEVFTVYRGQNLKKKKDFEELVRSKGELIAFNHFLSTNRKDNVSLLFAP
ncbi:unnamed protein product [Adineta ricciae]|uniref:Uncharacterized protein n=1 Tax=Adineta ricciae TaxID=249248 RepID=A0A815SV12_ADIRI|nr:unnamed protein product [Adineta ricciae]